MAPEIYSYGREVKTMTFRVVDDDHARLLIRLRHYNIKPAEFFRAITDATIEGDDRLVSFINDYVMEHRKLNRGRLNLTKKLIGKGAERVEDFGLLDEGEIENIFDLISKEHPEL
jgi:hypothetical protein